MDVIKELVLYAGMIIVCMYSIKTSHDSLMAIERMNNRIEMMFIRS